MTLQQRPAWEPEQPDLSGKTVAVVGGSGGVGAGVVRELLARGATVVATGRDARRLAMLTDTVPTVDRQRLVTTTLDAEAPDLEQRITELGESLAPFDGVVVSVATWGPQGRRPALSLTDEEWAHLLASNLTSVFRLYRGFLPHVRPTGTILQLNGMSADIPLPGGAGRALSGAATKSLTRSIAAERHGQGPRFYQMILGVIRTRERQEAGVDDVRWIDAEEVGAHVAGLVAATSPLTPYTVQYFVDKAAGPQVGSEE